MQLTHGTSTAAWKERWTLYVVLLKIRWSIRCREANAAVWLSAVCCYNSRTSCCWTNRPTTWMLSRSTGWNNIYNNIRVRLSASHTTVTSSTMWPDGFWNWIAEKVFLGKGTTLLGWIKRPNVWHRRRNKQVNAVRHWNAN